MEAPILEQYLVTQSNSLIEARPVMTLTKNEQKLILTFISLINPLDEDLKEYSIDVEQFADMIGIKDTNHSFVSEIKNMLIAIMEKTIEIPKEEGGFLLLHWLTKAEYVKKSREIRLRFDPELKPFLLELKSAFTQYQLSNILKLSSTFSIRLYELLKKHEHQGQWDVDLNDLRALLGATKSTYQRYFEFKVKVLNKAIEELNAMTDIRVDFYESAKEWRRVTRLCFLVRKKSDTEKSSPEWIDKKESLVAFLKTLVFKNLMLTDEEIEQISVLGLAIWNFEEVEDIQTELQFLCEYVDHTFNNDEGKLYLFEQLDFGLIHNEFTVSFRNINKRTNQTIKNKNILEKYRNLDTDLVLLITEKIVKQTELTTNERIYWENISTAK